MGGIERRGVAAICELRNYILANVTGLSMQLVDMVPEDSNGRVFSMRMIIKTTQVKPLFPHFPVNVPLVLGMQVSVKVNDVWKPSETCWNFIPVEPLLGIAQMQDLAQVMDTTPPPPPPYSPSSSESEITPPPSPVAECSPEKDAQEMQLESHKARLEMEHRFGMCVPCSFHAFRSDGCRHGDACEFCHRCTAQEARARRK